MILFIFDDIYCIIFLFVLFFLDVCFIVLICGVLIRGLLRFLFDCLLEVLFCLFEELYIVFNVFIIRV